MNSWLDTSRAIGYGRMTVNSEPVLKWWRDGDGEKADIADVVLRMIDGEADWHPKGIDDMAKENHAIQTLIEKLDLKQIEP